MEEEKTEKTPSNGARKETNKKGKGKKVLSGVVVSTKQDKTAVVRVERYASHPKYKKFVRMHKKYQAHDPENSCKEGDKVLIKECRKRSKNKAFDVIK